LFADKKIGGFMKMDVQEIVVDGKTYVPKETMQDIVGDLKIVILQRGWVMIGNLERIGNDCKLHNASVVRKWGTTGGLGELANEGPKSETKLDKCFGVVEFDYLTVIAAISCRGEVWQKGR
jgi:hypothetical protein